MTADTLSDTTPDQRGEPRYAPLITDKRLRLFVFLTLMTAVFMAMIDNQIVSTALPTIVGEFGHPERFSWVGSAYLLTSSAVMPLYGKLGDLFGRKYVMMATIFIFTVGSAVCGLAVSMNTLIAARVLQAIGGGGIMVTIFSINADLFEPRERARYQSYSSLVLMLSGSIGPTLGGLLTDLFGWRSIFLINIPIGIAVLIALAFLLPYKRPDRKPKVDYLGALLLAGAIASVVLWADSSELFGSLIAPQSLVIVALGIACVLGWIAVEKRVEEPVVPLHLFKSPTIRLLLIITMVSGCLGIGLANYFALFFQTGLGMTPSMAGLLFIPITVGIAVGSVNAGKIMSRTGYYKNFSILSTGVCTVATFLFIFVDAETSLYLLIPLCFIHGLGVGVGQQVPVLGVQNAAPYRDLGAATGATTLTRIGGASIGISIYGAIVSHGIGNFHGTIPGVENFAKLTPAQIATLPVDAQNQISHLYAAACHPLFLVAAFLGFIGFVAALCLKNVQLGTQYQRD